MTREEITTARDTHDRSRTAAMLAMLREFALDDDLRGELEQALEVLDDTRAIEPLRAMVADRAGPAVVRESAAYVLADMRSGPSESDAEIEAAFLSGDAVLRPIAVRRMGRAHEALLLPILDDPSHPEHAAAIDACVCGFDRPRFTTHVIRALAHPSADVRVSAAESLLFTEPVAAIEPLIAALDDSDPRVAEAALETLAYIESRRVLEALATFAERTGEPELRQNAAGAVRHVASVLAFDLRPGPRAHPFYRTWLEPVWRWIEPALAKIDGDPALAESEPANPYAGLWPVKRIVVPACASLATFRAHFSGIDRPWTDHKTELTLCDWDAVPMSEREALASALVEWPDTAVRLHAPDALHAWRDIARLIEMLDDPCPAVATSACWRLADVGQHALAAARVRTRFESVPDGSRRSEALMAYVALARPEEWQSLVRSILTDDDVEEYLRITAAGKLGRPEAVDLTREHLPLLSEAPRVRWDVHAALLDAAKEHALRTPDLSLVRAADNGRVILALLDYEASMAG